MTDELESAKRLAYYWRDEIPRARERGTPEQLAEAQAQYEAADQAVRALLAQEDT